MIIHDNIPLAKEKFLKALRDSANEIKVTEIANVQVNTPVGDPKRKDETPGALRRSIAGNCKVRATGFNVEIGSPLAYAKKVEFQDKSYLISTFKDDEENIQDIINKHIQGAQL